MLNAHTQNAEALKSAVGEHGGALLHVVFARCRGAAGGLALQIVIPSPSSQR